MILPSRIKDMPPGDERRFASLRFYLALAALHASYKGTITGLAEASGISRAYLSNIWRGTDPISVKVAIAIEKTVGRDVVSRADLLPEIFNYEYEVSNVE